MLVVLESISILDSGDIALGRLGWDGRLSAAEHLGMAGGENGGWAVLDTRALRTSAWGLHLVVPARAGLGHRAYRACRRL